MVGETEDLRPVPAQNVFKKLKTPQFLWPALIIAIVGLVILVLATRPQSQLQIKAHEDKFKVDFFLKGKDRAKAEEFLEKLLLPQSVLEGQEFELDSTSSAKLAFASPVVLNLKFKTDSISFSGTSHIPLYDANLPTPTGSKIPTTASIILYGQDFKPIITKEAHQTEFGAWLEDNLSSQNGQYLMLFDEGFALKFKPQKPLDLVKLQEIKSPSEPLYKQETVTDTIVHLVKISSEEQETWAIYQIGDWVLLASSFDIAKNVLALELGEAPYINFPKTDQNVSLVIYFRDQEVANPNSLSLITTNSQKLTKYLDNIKEALIVLDGEKISGSIDF